MKNKMKQVLAIIFIIIGLLLTIGFISIIISSDITINKIREIFDYKILNTSEIDKKFDHKNGLILGKINYHVTDPVYNVSADAFKIERLVEKWNGDNWIIVDNYDDEAFNTMPFTTNDIKVGKYTIKDNYSDINTKDIINLFVDFIDEDVYLRDNGMLDYSNANLPNNFSIQELYNNNLDVNIKYITNSNNIKIPKAGDIRITFIPKYLFFNNYLVGIGRIRNDEIYVNANQFSFISGGASVDILLELSHIAVFALKFLSILICLMPTISFMLLFFGVSMLNIFKEKVGEIKKYKIVIFSLLLGVIIPLILMWINSVTRFTN